MSSKVLRTKWKGNGYKMRKLEKMIVFILIIILVLLNMVLFSVFFVFSDEDIKKFVNFECESVETAEQTE